LAIAPADQVANGLMNRALAANVELSFELDPDLALNAATAAILNDTEQLLDVRRRNIDHDERKKASNKARSSERIARKLRFSKDVSAVEDMDTN
jgi:hypothetical protein